MPVYLGQDGHVVCTWLNCQAQMDRVPGNMAVGSLVNAIKLRPRPGQCDMVFWTEETRITLCLDTMHRNGPYVFPYDMTLCPAFCTCAFVQHCNLGDHVSIVLRVLGVTPKQTQGSGDPYLEVIGIDMDQTMVTPLRLWRYQDGDMEENKTYIIRGLKVAPAKVWDAHQWQYIIRADGSKALECTSCTAVEDVSHIQAISAIF